MLSRGGPFGWRRSHSVPETLIEGWPGDPEIRDLAVQCMSTRLTATVNSGVLEPLAALTIVIKGYSNDPIASVCLAQVMREEEHAFVADSHALWSWISEAYAGNALMISAADEWFRRWSTHRYPECFYAARLGWTEMAKKCLITNLDSSFPGWSAGALLEHWGMADPEVASTLLAISRTERVADIGHLLPRIVLDRKECFSRLIDVLESTVCRNPGLVVEGLATVSEPSQRDRVINAALPWAERRQVVGYRERVVRALLEHFGNDSRVRALARQEMQRRGGDWITTFGLCCGDVEIQSQARRWAAPLPAELRSEIVSFLEIAAFQDEECIALLGLYDLESDPDLKTRMAIAYFNMLKRSLQSPAQALEQLTDALSSGGLDFEARHQAAVCGLQILGRLDLLLSLQEEKHAVVVEIHSQARPNEAIVVHLLEHWEEFQTALGRRFEATFSRNGMSDLYWWSQVADFADQYPVVRDRLLTLLREAQGEQLYAELLQFLGRTRPKSGLLLEHCVAIIAGRGRPTSRWIDVDTAAFLLGRDFAGDNAVLAELTKSHSSHDWEDGRVLWALCEGWPDSEPVKNVMARMREHCDPNIGIQIHEVLDMQVLCAQGTAEEVAQAICAFVSRPHLNLSYQPAAFCRPLYKRVRRDRYIQEIFDSRLMAPRNVSEAYSIAGLLARTLGITDTVRAWCLANAVPKPSLSSPVYSDPAFNLNTGAVMNSWQVAMDVLGGSPWSAAIASIPDYS
jgi:hypothetical protein